MAFKLIMATRASETIGFPAVLNEMMKKARYDFRPEYTVYACGIGVGLVEFMACLRLEARMVVGAETYDFQAFGTSVEGVIQEVARVAIARLRYEHRELWEDPFSYLPVRGPGEVVAHVISPPLGPYTMESCMAETVNAYEIALRSMRWELDETRHRLANLQSQVEPYVRMNKVPRKIYNTWATSTPQEEAPPSHRSPHAIGAWAEAAPRLHYINEGRIRRIDVVNTTREVLLGAPEPFHP